MKFPQILKPRNLLLAAKVAPTIISLKFQKNFKNFLKYCTPRNLTVAGGVIAGISLLSVIGGFASVTMAAGVIGIDILGSVALHFMKKRAQVFKDRRFTDEKTVEKDPIRDSEDFEDDYAGPRVVLPQFNQARQQKEIDADEVLMGFYQLLVNRGDALKLMPLSLFSSYILKNPDCGINREKLVNCIKPMLTNQTLESFLNRTGLINGYVMRVEIARMESAVTLSEKIKCFGWMVSNLIGSVEILEPWNVLNIQFKDEDQALLAEQQSKARNAALM